MLELPQPITNLKSALAKLPGIGPRSAERLAIHLVQRERPEVQQLAEALLAAKDTISYCQICGTLTQEQPCTICTSPKRDSTLICLVEQAVDVLSIEKAGTFHGLYHVLGGRLSPLDGVEPEDLRIAELEKRLNDSSVNEVIIALSSDVEGDATSFYLSKRLASPGVTVTRLAQGLPVGSGLEFADELTLGRALEGRQELNQDK